MAIFIQFIQKLFQSKWKRQTEKNEQSFTQRRRGACVLKSISSKSSSCYGLVTQHSKSVDSINFEFRNSKGNIDLCCVRKCCKKCFCTEGEAVAAGVRKSWRNNVKSDSWCEKCDMGSESLDVKCGSQYSISAFCGSIDINNCETSSNSSCQDDDCQYRYGDDCVRNSTAGVPVHAFANIHAATVAGYDTLTPPYENLPNTEISATVDIANTVDVFTDGGADGCERSCAHEPLYDSVPPRPPRAISEPNYANVLSISCIDNCVFRQISSLIDAAQSHAQMVQSLQHLHKDYSCVRRYSPDENENSYTYENYADYENDLTIELERSLSD